jgi:chemotaxis protein methyltransferase CheR
MTLNESQLKYFADYIEKELGIVYTNSNYFQLDQRLEKIAHFLGLKDQEAVHEKAIKEGIHGDFKQFLLDTATNNETSFFRDPKVFTAIENVILPSFQEQMPSNFIFRIWCAAASFGQEPYSLAILVYEFLEKNPGHPKIEIIATDIAQTALNRCTEARYSQLEVQRGLGSSRLVKYFTKVGDDQWELNGKIKTWCSLRKKIY